MNNFGAKKIQHIWLLVSAASLILPLNYVLENNQQNLEFSQVITVILAILFIFSLPFSLFASPLLALFRYGIELDLNTPFGAYFFIVLLNIFGYLQWFWLMPVLFNNRTQSRLPTILSNQ